MSRMPTRLRLSLAFAVAMALLLAALGTFLYLQVRSSLDEQLDGSLRAEAASVPAAGLGERRALVEEEKSIAQVLGPGGAVRGASPATRSRAPCCALSSTCGGGRRRSRRRRPASGSLSPAPATRSGGSARR